MASTRIKPFPLHGLVPYRGALYSITHQEVFSQGRLYRIGRYVGDRYDERVMINHWDLLENMEKLARFNVGDDAWHRTLGAVRVEKRVWRFGAGRIVYHLTVHKVPAQPAMCWQDELVSVSLTTTVDAAP